MLNIYLKCRIVFRGDLYDMRTKQQSLLSLLLPFAAHLVVWGQIVNGKKPLEISGTVYI